MNPVFAARTGWNLASNALASLISEARKSGRRLADLTESNPTRVGLSPGADLIARLGDARGAIYEPIALGHPHARAAIASYYRDHGVDDVRNIVLSASTS